MLIQALSSEAKRFSVLWPLISDLWPLGGLLFPVELRPNTQHDVAEEEGIQRDERNVAAEVEGQHQSQHVEQESAGFFTFQILAGQDRHRPPVESPPLIPTDLNAISYLSATKYQST
jgi:hypothetical protein